MNLDFMQMAIKIAMDGMKHKGHGPFGAVIVKGKEIIGMGTNQVTSGLDPTAHAEVMAIRNSCQNLGDFSLKGCEIYTSCEPCPMCLGAIFWARLDKVYYGAMRDDAALAHFDDHQFYEEIKKSPLERAVPMVQVMRAESIKLFDVWNGLTEKIPY